MNYLKEERIVNIMRQKKKFLLEKIEDYKTKFACKTSSGTPTQKLRETDHEKS